MDALIVSGEAELGSGTGGFGGVGRHYTQVEWTTTLRDAMGPQWFAFLDRASALTMDDGSDVRAVFFFDN